MVRSLGHAWDRCGWVWPHLSGEAPDSSVQSKHGTGVPWACHSQYLQALGFHGDSGSTVQAANLTPLPPPI